MYNSLSKYEKKFYRIIRARVYTVLYTGIIIFIMNAIREFNEADFTRIYHHNRNAINKLL